MTSDERVRRPAPAGEPADVARVRPDAGARSLGLAWMYAASRVLFKRLKRAPLHWSISDLVRWEPLVAPEDGYTVVIACMRDLHAVACANLLALSRMQLSQMRELIMVFDCTETDVPAPVRAQVAALADRLPIRVIGYDPRQARIAARIRWGWVYSWLSWCIGMAASRTRHVVLHDLDAVPLSPQLFDTRFEQARLRQSQFHGMQWYVGNGVSASMQLATTFELVLDVQYVRATFRPFDAFNHATLIDGSYVDFDTLLRVQRNSPRRSVQPLAETDLTHPSRMICQYTDFVAGRDRLDSESHNVLMLPYFCFLGGQADGLRAIAERWSVPGARSVPFAGRELPIGHLPPLLWAWLEKQIRRVEQSFFGHTRPEVESYLAGFVVRAGDQRTVGQEQGPNAVPAR